MDRTAVQFGFALVRHPQYHQYLEGRYEGKCRCRAPRRIVQPIGVGLDG